MLRFSIMISIQHKLIEISQLYKHVIQQNLLMTSNMIIQSSLGFYLISSSLIYCLKSYLLSQVLYIVSSLTYCLKSYLLSQVLYIVSSLTYCLKPYLFYQVLPILPSLTYSLKAYPFS